MSEFRYVRVELPAEKRLWNSAIVAAMNSLMQILLVSGDSLGTGDVRIRTSYDPERRRDEVLITWDKNE